MASERNIILITGTTSGIGYDTSYALANASPSNHVIMTARSTEKGTKALAEIQSRKPAGTLGFLQLDVTSDASISDAAQKVEADFGVLDVLVNNAGIASSDYGPDNNNNNNTAAGRAYLREIFDTNVFGVHLLTEALEPLLEKSKDPRIVNLTTNTGSVTWRNDWTQPASYKALEAYRMSKAALNMMSANQLYKYSQWEHPAKVWAYCPGWVVTNLTGVDGRQFMRDTGAEDSETSAQGILEIVNGKRDEETKVMITKRGGTYPW
ncbi:Uu.00g052730.m01.CDS01 [Anthostomella pinea]|uniref:Uu.00g052730.m01.CDS01 n=1 Tax=Anthostomella pinea TaxID=933095 RepID=A0AAI8YPF3_9PEZI|nr:Uu.00g052730.m01.CDS01 [Anthostomella pinea]